MEKKKKTSKRRSWKKDYLALEKKHKNLLKTKVKLEETVENLLNSNDQISQHIDQLLKEADAFRRNKSLIKTRIHQIENKKYFWIGGIARLKSELRDLL